MRRTAAPAPRDPVCSFKPVLPAYAEACAGTAAPAPRDPVCSFKPVLPAYAEAYAEARAAPLLLRPETPPAPLSPSSPHTLRHAPRRCSCARDPVCSFKPVLPAYAEACAAPLLLRPETRLPPGRPRHRRVPPRTDALVPLPRTTGFPRGPRNRKSHLYEGATATVRSPARQTVYSRQERRANGHISSRRPFVADTSSPFLF